MNQTSHLFLIDGSSYLYRAYHGMPPLTNAKGEPTGAIYGVANMLRRLLQEHDPDHVVVIFDAKGKTFRNDLYAEYKANRPPMPEELVAQLEPIHALVEALGLPLLQVGGVEADDVIGTLAVAGERADFRVTIVTGDKDMAQLVNSRVHLLNSGDDSVLDSAGVEAKFGVPPDLMVDYLSLVGDTSDNVPGVPKVGPKTAVKWLQAYGSLDEVLAHADEIKGKVGESLRASFDHLPLSRTLVTIKCDVPLDVGPQQLVRRAPDTLALESLYQRFEFRTWLAELAAGDHGGDESATGQVAAQRPAEYETVLDAASFERWVDQLEAAEFFAFDTETTSLDYMQAEIVGVSFAVAAGQAAYVPVDHRYTGAPDQLERDTVLRRLKPLLEDPKRKKLGQNLKYDMSVLARYGIEMRGVSYDTMLESYVLDSTATRHDMDSLALKYLQHSTIRYEDVAGKGAKQLSFDQVPLETAAPYAAEDADVTLRLHQTLWPQLQAEATLGALFDEVEMPLVPVLSRMERTGVRIDAQMLGVHSRELAQRLKELEAEAWSLADEQFNLASPKQIQAILFDKLKLPVKSKTPKGQPSTAESVLQDLALDYPLPRVILEHRGLSKLKSTYTDALPTRINPQTGRVHTSFHQAVASTGRLSSSEPNLQNIPIRTEEGRRIRQAFVAPPGYRILAADYSQVELRIMAHLSRDEGLMRAFAQGVDVHQATAAEVFGVAEGKVTGDQRRSAKAINFGLIYGMSAFGLARQLDLTREQAQGYVDKYFARYPGVKRFMDDIRVQAREQGYVETVFGRRLHLPEIHSRNAARRQYAERTAINAPMQGTAADIIKRAMIEVDAWLPASGIDALMIMQVHDELVFEVADADVPAVINGVTERMQSAAVLSVPLVVDVGTGSNWDEAH